MFLLSVEIFLENKLWKSSGAMAELLPYIRQ